MTAAPSTPEPPAHLSPGAQEYLQNPDVLDYPTSWTDAWGVQEFRDIAHPLWASMNDTLDFDYTVTHEVLAGVPVQRISVETNASSSAPQATSPDNSNQEKVIVHLHGGMYCLGTPEIDFVLNAPLAQATGLDVISVDYRLAPEHPFPAAVDDAVAVCTELTNQGISFVLYGESAGGGLAAACALSLRDAGLAQPKCVALMSPMLDLTGSSDTYQTLARVDPDYGDTRALLDPGQAYAGEAPLNHPLVSPLFAKLEGLPPLLIQVGNREVLLGDSTRFARAARTAGVPTQLHVLDGGWHNYPIWHGVPEADLAVAQLGAFLSGGFT